MKYLLTIDLITSSKTGFFWSGFSSAIKQKINNIIKWTKIINIINHKNLPLCLRETIHFGYGFNETYE